MSQYNSLKATIDANIKQNGVQAITGSILNSVLNQMVDSLKDGGYLFGGILTPTATLPTPDQKIAYLASDPGTYGSLSVGENELAIIKFDSAWSKSTLNISLEHPVEVEDSDNDADLDLSDEDGNVLARFENGHIRVKNFDSAKNNSNIGLDSVPLFSEEEEYSIGAIVNYDGLLYKFISDHEVGEWDETEVEQTNLLDSGSHPVDVKNSGNVSDLDISDDDGNVLVRFENGHIRTKKFNSAELNKIKTFGNLELVEDPQIVPNGQNYADDGRHNFNGWVFGTQIADSANGIIGYFYTSCPLHGSRDYGVLMFKRRVNGIWQAPVLVSPTPAAGKTWYGCSAMMIGNDYVTIAKSSNPTGAYYMFRSSDKGITWTQSQLQDTNGNAIIGDGPCSLMKTNSGRYMFFHWEYGVSAIWYSDDGMITWTRVQLPAGGANMTEGCIRQLHNGKLVLIRRSGDVAGVKQCPYLLISDNDGLTWTTGERMGAIDCDTNPVFILSDDLHSKVFLFYASRWQDSDGAYRVNMMETSEKGIEYNIMSGGITLFRQYQRDMGYCGAAIDENGFINLFWYNSPSAGIANVWTAKFKINTGITLL